MTTIIKTIYQAFKKTTELLVSCLQQFKIILVYLCSITISINNFAELLILIGSVILIIGVLFKNPTDIINNSIIASNGPGMITGYYPDRIQEFIRSNNKVVLGLLVLVYGFLISVLSPQGNYNIFLIKWIVVTLILIFMLGAIIAGFNRQRVINIWKNNKCRYRWLLNDFLNNKINGSQDSLHNTLARLKFIQNALSMEDNSNFKDDKESSLQDIENLQFSIRRDIENTSIFYYFLKPKRLFKDLFLT